MAKKIDITNALFDSELNDYCRKFIIKGEFPITEKDVREKPARYQNIKAKIFEDFILNEKINYKVYGENIPLAVLVNELGLYNVESLIETQSLSFTLWTAGVGYIASPVPGALPLISSRHNSTVHSDPEESIITGLSVLRRNKLKAGEQRVLLRKLRNNYLDIPVGLEQNCVFMTISALESGKLSRLGIDLAEKKLTDLSTEDKKTLGKAAEELFNFKYLVSKRIRATATDNVSAILDESFSRIDKAQIFQQISNIENFPDLRTTFIEMGLPMNDIIRLRNDRHAKKFRKWLCEAEGISSADEISKYYLDSISNAKGFFDSFMGKSTKSIIMMAASGLTASKVATPLGRELGAISGLGVLALQPALDYTLDMVDEYLISELTKGWTPRMFFKKINNHAEKYKICLD